MQVYDSDPSGQCPTCGQWWDIEWDEDGPRMLPATRDPRITDLVTLARRVATETTWKDVYGDAIPAGRLRAYVRRLRTLGTQWTDEEVAP